jgi:hypothetical protein
MQSGLAEACGDLRACILCKAAHDTPVIRETNKQRVELVAALRTQVIAARWPRADLHINDSDEFITKFYELVFSQKRWRKSFSHFGACTLNRTAIEQVIAGAGFQQGLYTVEAKQVGNVRKVRVSTDLGNKMYSQYLSAHIMARSGQPSGLGDEKTGDVIECLLGLLPAWELCQEQGSGAWPFEGNVAAFVHHLSTQVLSHVPPSPQQRLETLFPAEAAVAELRPQPAGNSTAASAGQRDRDRRREPSRERRRRNDEEDRTVSRSRRRRDSRERRHRRRDSRSRSHSRRTRRTRSRSRRQRSPSPL